MCMQNVERDYLTGLFTRQYLYTLYEKVDAESLFHLMFMDLDNFKSVNDVYGHNEGDLLLKAVARILETSAPNAHCIRLGGDEFLLFFEDTCSREKLSNIANNIIYRIFDKEGFKHITTNVSASIGILYNETAKNSLSDLLLKSDKAMYYAKTHGKGCFVIYNDIQDELSSEIRMEQMQQTALDNGEFEIRYLPIISAQTSRLRATQVRLFWNMSDGTTKSQDDFIALFEKNGFIRSLNMWMLDTVFSEIQTCEEEETSLGDVSIRISKLLLLEKDFSDVMKNLTEKYNISPCGITIEIDENAFTRGSGEMFHTMSELKQMGFKISIIGVGSEFKSLAYWDKFEFDFIMFDPDYIRRTLATPRGKQIIITLLSMGRQLKMQVIADGISSREDVIYLCSYGCNAISGPYYSEPLAKEDYLKYICDKRVVETEKIEFAFINNFISKDEKYSGKVVGDGIQFAPGISECWGSIRFPGGFFLENVLEFPGSILSESWTVCFWVNPTQITSWTSAFYAKYQSHYVTYSPYVEGGCSIFRISDGTFHGWNDMLLRALQPDNSWHFICMTYDEHSGISRSYLDGINGGILTDLPSLPACQNIYLGGDAFQPSYEGYISGLMFFNQAKSDEEISNLYEQFKREPGFAG